MVVVVVVVVSGRWSTSLCLPSSAYRPHWSAAKRQQQQQQQHLHHHRPRQDKTRHKTSFSDEKPNEKREVLGWEGCLVVLVDSSRGRVDKLASGPKRRTRQPSPMAFNLAAACLSSQSYSSTSSYSSLDSSSTLFLDPFFSLKLFYCLAAAAAAAAVNWPMMLPLLHSFIHSHHKALRWPFI